MLDLPNAMLPPGIPGSEGPGALGRAMHRLEATLAMVLPAAWARNATVAVRRTIRSVRRLFD